MKLPDHSYRILINGSSGSGITDSLFNLISNQQYIDKTFLYARDPYKAKCKLLINKRESINVKHFNDPESFIEYSNNMDTVDKNIGEYNPNKKQKILIVFDDAITDMLSNKKRNPIVTELFIRGRKHLEHFFCFLSHNLTILYQFHALYHTVLLYCKFYALFHYENSKQVRTLTDYIQSFVRHRI